MASLSIRRLDEKTFKQLKARASRNGVSMEEEARRILRTAVAPPENLGQYIHSLFGSEEEFELELPEKQFQEPLDLSS